jgi:hypothetical protein
VLPAMLRRHPLRVCSAALGVVVLGYLPHVAAVGGAVIGYLPGYLKEEDYTDGGRFLLLARVLPKPVLTAAAVLVLVVAAVLVARSADPDRPEDFAVVMVGVGLLVTTPSYSWYAVLLLALVAMTARVEWLPLAIMPTLSTLGAVDFGNGVSYRTSCYAIGLAAAVAGSLIRYWPAVQVGLARVRLDSEHR